MRLACITWGQGLALVSALCATGCSFVYDADVFAGEAADAMPPPPDVDITALALTAAEPAEVFEGVGCIPESTGCAGESRAVPVVVRGMSIAPTATVALSGAGFDDDAVAATVSTDGMMLAFALSVPVISTLADGATETIVVTVSQGDVSDSVMLTVRGLDEFTASVDANGGTMDGSALKSLYSTIDIDTAIALTGTTRARFAATASITIDATLSANGDPGVAETGGSGVASGGDGGAAETPGDCLAGGGRAGGTSAGGGGGGHSTMGSQGATGSGGAGGQATGSDELVPLASEAGNGGGGGGPGAIAGAGGGGGAGGGVIELTSLGIVSVGTDGGVTANGGAGAGGAGSCALLDQHGGGGGGGDCPPRPVPRETPAATPVAMARWDVFAWTSRAPTPHPRLPAVYCIAVRCCRPRPSRSRPRLRSRSSCSATRAPPTTSSAKATSAWR